MVSDNCSSRTNFLSKEEIIFCRGRIFHKKRYGNETEVLILQLDYHFESFSLLLNLNVPIKKILVWKKATVEDLKGSWYKKENLIVILHKKRINFPKLKLYFYVEN